MDDLKKKLQEEKTAGLEFRKDLVAQSETIKGLEDDIAKLIKVPVFHRFCFLAACKDHVLSLDGNRKRRNLSICVEVVKFL